MTEKRNIVQQLDVKANWAGDDVCFYDVERAHAAVTWKQVRLRAAKLAHTLAEEGVQPGDLLAADMGNCEAYLYLVLAAAYGGFAVVALNARLTEEEKTDRLLDVLHATGTEEMKRLREAQVMRMVRERGGMPTADLVRWSQRAMGTYKPDATAVVMFTSGTQGTPKAAALTWENLLGAARASNAALGVGETSVWQLALPMYHVGGLQVALRALVAGVPFMLYRTFNAQTILHDAAQHSATHISVVDAMLQDLLTQAETSEDTAAALAAYDCLLLGGAAPNPTTLARAEAAGARVVTSYGMTETCGCVAVAAHMIPGYSAAIIHPDEQGIGQLAVRGPGVFGGYLNARADFTADGCFITGDTAALQDGILRVMERTGDMFVSGGENVYPEEIRAKVLACDGVTDAFVFGAEDERWGRRPVAFVEMPAVAEAGMSPQRAADDVAASLAVRLSRVYQPKHIVVVPELPRRGIGKINRAKLQMRYNERIQIVQVDMWRIRQPFANGGVRTPKTTLHERESLLVQVTDWAGRTGIGEDVAFSTPWYLPETIDGGIPVIEKTLIPLLTQHVFLHPAEISTLFNTRTQAATHPLACAALESACWDLYGKIMGRSIRSLIGGRDQVAEDGSLAQVPVGCVPGGAVIGLGTVRETLQAVEQARVAGYTRVKLKIKPGHDIKIAAAVAKAYPHMTLMLDANQSYTEDDLPTLQQLDRLDIACLEEPLDPHRPPRVGPQKLHARLARLQRSLRMPIALDESWTTATELDEILRTYADLRCVVVKVGKFGGVQHALEFCANARARGVNVWMGGMFETGVGKRLAAAFATLPVATLPGDLSDSSRYFAVDVCDPPFALEDGCVRVNPKGFEAGLGCRLSPDALHQVALWHKVYE